MDKKQRQLVWAMFYANIVAMEHHHPGNTAKGHSATLAELAVEASRMLALYDAWVETEKK